MDPTRPVGDIEANEGTRLLELNGEKALTDVPDQTPVELLVAGFAAVSFSTSVAAIFFHMDPIVTVSGVIGALVAPFAAFQQQKITEAKYLSQTNKRGMFIQSSLSRKGNADSQLIDLCCLFSPFCSGRGSGTTQGRNR